MPVPPATFSGVREDYLAGQPVARILAKFEIPIATLYACLDGGDDGTGTVQPPIPRRRDVMGQRRRDLKTQRRSLVARLYRTAERQVCDIETRLARMRQEPAERERDVRVLAILVKTLRELSAFDAASSAPTGAAADADRGPEDIDEFRRELTRRIEGLIASRAGSRIPGKPA